MRKGGKRKHASELGFGIHSKSEDPDPNYPAKKFELSANLFKNATKWPQNDQNGPMWPKNDPNWPWNDPK